MQVKSLTGVAQRPPCSGVIATPRHETIGADAREIPQGDLRLGQASPVKAEQGIAACESARDDVSRDLMREILEDTEEPIDELATQTELVARLGMQNCLQSHAAAQAARRRPRRVDAPAIAPIAAPASRPYSRPRPVLERRRTDGMENRDDRSRAGAAGEP